jgi:2-keto-4-pentenoate hydratase
MTPSDALRAAELLCEHWRRGTALQALPPGLRPATRAEGHAIQAALPSVAQRSVVGWKIAATSSAGQAHIGVSGPLAGRILSGELLNHGATVSLHGNRMRVVEPEFAFRFGADLKPRAEPYTVPEVLDAVAAMHPSLEAPNSRFADFAHAGEAQLQADNACCGRFVVGEPAPAGWRALDLRTLAVQGRVTDAGGRSRLTRTGTGSVVLGDPRVALTWLVNELRAFGIALRASDIVSTGTCMVPLEVQPGDTVEADYGVLGRLGMHLSA